MVLLAVALMVGCNRQIEVPSQPPAAWTATPVMFTATATPPQTSTPSAMATRTGTWTPTATPSPTATNPAGFTDTSTATFTPTSTNLGVFTDTPTPTMTPLAVQGTVVLGSAANYVILSYTGISNNGPSTTCGGYGVYPDGWTSVTGSPALVENCGGAIDVGDATASTAKLDLGTAYTDAMGRPSGATLAPGGDIGGETLYPGCYVINSDLNIASADLTLDAQGNPNAVFIFQVKTGGNLIVGPGRQVILSGNAQAANIFWAVSGYCSLDTSVQFVGNIMAYSSVTFNTGATLLGRALASNGNVTLLTNTITHP